MSILLESERVCGKAKQCKKMKTLKVFICFQACNFTSRQYCTNSSFWQQKHFLFCTIFTSHHPVYSSYCWCNVNIHHRKHTNCLSCTVSLFNSSCRSDVSDTILSFCFSTQPSEHSKYVSWAVLSIFTIIRLVFCVGGEQLCLYPSPSCCARASLFSGSRRHQLADALSESCRWSWDASSRHVRLLGIGIGFPQTPLSKD